MNASTVTSLVVFGFIAFVLELLGVTLGPGYAVAAGGVAALVNVGAFRQFEIHVSPGVAIALTPVCTAVALLVAVIGAGGEPGVVWLAPVLAAAISGAFVAAKRIGSRRCTLCRRRLRGVVSFECPRCQLEVCDNCWVFERLRCRLCHDNNVSVFSPDGRWWDRQFGPRTTFGRCHLCMATAADADLRPCRQCGRPQCRECWDTSNGVCQRCGWTVEDLPDSLRPYMGNTGRQAAERSASPP
jgi:hypothetical protein